MYNLYGLSSSRKYFFRTFDKNAKYHEILDINIRCKSLYMSTDLMIDIYDIVFIEKFDFTADQ